MRLPQDALFCPSCGVSTSPDAQKTGPIAPGQRPGWDHNVKQPSIPSDLFRDQDATTIRPSSAPPPRPSRETTWRPLAAGTPEADLLPSELAEAGPASPRRKTGFVPLVILLTLVLIGAVVGAIMLFTSGSPPPPPLTADPAMSTSPNPRTSTPSLKPPSTPAPSATPSPSGPSSATPATDFPPAGATACPGSADLAVGSNTSCQFAANIAAAIPPGASGSFQITANSPVTGKDYQMNCTRTTHIMCTGGDNATVYIR